MGILKRRNDPVNETERELSDLVARRGALEQKAAQAKTALAAALDQRRQTLLDSDLSDEAAASRRDAEVRDLHRTGMHRSRDALAGARGEDW